jgi:hypothetical protein
MASTEPHRLPTGGDRWRGTNVGEEFGGNWVNVGRSDWERVTLDALG